MTNRLVLFCSGGCERDIKVAFPIEMNSLTGFLMENGWFLSALTAPGQGSNVPIDMGATCRECAERLMPELVAHMDLKK